MADEHHQILIIGAGAAGISVAASLQRHNDGHDFDIGIIDPATDHYYQPAFTLVGGGCYSLEKTRRSTSSLIPNGVKWIQKKVSDINAEDNYVVLDDQQHISYDYLVVCPGLVLDFDAIAGLKESIGKNGVCSNYSPDYTEYTWECIQNLKAGDRAIFSQAPLPFKCPGAPQKIAYLAADHLKQQGLLDKCNVDFVNPGPGMFAVPYFAKELTAIADRYGIKKRLLHKLTKIDGENKVATIEAVDGETKGQVHELEYAMIHVTPHQKTPDFLHGCSVSNDAGYVDVHQNSMQHVKYANVFGLGDACSTPNSKTAAAIRKQAPVVVDNIKRSIDGSEMNEGYNGYGSCPLTTARGKVLMAEFIYGGKVTPTLPYIAKPNVESSMMWHIKTIGLPMLYWDFMLKGYEKFLEPKWDYIE